MKTLKTVIMCTLMALLPMAASAQEKIMKAFNSLIDNNFAEIVESHTLDRNPETGVKEGQSDVYRFTIPTLDMDLIKNIMKAFRESSDKAYSISSGRAERNEMDVNLAVGNGSGIRIADRGSDYIYACFLAPKSEDPAGNYRYAYAMSYKKNGDKIVGKLIVTYATTLKYRQESNIVNGTLMANNLKLIVDDSNHGAWFQKFMTLIQGMQNVSSAPQPALAMATKIYEHTQKIGTNVPDQDKELAKEMISTLIDSHDYNEMIKKLLNAAIANIK